MSKTWDEVMNGAKLTQDEIRGIYEEAMGKIRGANAALSLAREQLSILRSRCSHPRSSKYNCPDCGADWSD